MKFKTLIFLLLVSLPSMAQRLAWNESEKSVDYNSMMPIVRTVPLPSSGYVETNSPYFIWTPETVEITGYHTHIWNKNQLYKCRISQSRDFADKNTIVSPLQEWTFFVPNQKLAKGDWYWQYCRVDKESRKESWSEVIKFTITGDEREFVAPSAENYIDNIPTSHPRFLSTQNDIGNMNFSKKEVADFLSEIDDMVDKKLPETLIYNDRAILDVKQKELSEENYTRYIDKATKEKYKPHVAHTINILKAYLITGEQKYRNEAMRRYLYMKAQYEDICRKDYSNDFIDGMFRAISAQVFDVLYYDLSQQDRESIVSILVEEQEKIYQGFLYDGALDLMSSHLWQHHMRNFFTTSIILLGHTPDAEKWVSCVYDLWRVRAPIGSGDDGGWVAGNGYMEANLESLYIMPYLLSKFSGVNFYDDPWYKNVGSYLFLTAPVGHIAGAYGDNADVKHTPGVGLISALNSVVDDPYAKEYVRLYSKGYELKNQKINSSNDLFWFQNQKHAFPKVKGSSKELSRAKAFRDCGTTAFHTDLSNKRKNLMLSFRSSPFGVTGHSHAAQNTFNIQYGGMPLFFRTGYYSSWCDFHSLQSYKHTRAHNGVLADGNGTALFTDGYGWIPRFIEGDEISYVMGDASNAYDGTVARDEFVENAPRWGVEFTPENGFGSPGVERFRRHVVMLRPNIIVIYDELAAKKPVNWSWLIHSKDTLSLEKNVFYTQNKYGKGKASIYSGSESEVSVTDKFYAKATDWLGNGYKKGIEYTNHWHGSATTDKESEERFLAIIEVVDKESGEGFSEVRAKDGVYRIGDWVINVEMNRDEKPMLNITNQKNRSGFSYGEKPLKLGGKSFKHNITGSSFVVEDGQCEEVVDELPAAARFR